MEKPATDIYTFEKLRKYGFTYVDKTAQLLPLVNMSIGTQFFLARPRRFGKSLLISTLRCLFEGRRDLFQGLAIEDKRDWSQKWPVIYLDMGTARADTIAEHGQKAFRGFFANIPYNLTDRQNEGMWQAIVYVILRAIGVAFSSEQRTITGNQNPRIE